MRRGGHCVQPLESRILLSSISGRLWWDADSDGIIDATETFLSGWTVYLDQNRNHQRDASETFLLTDSQGQYSFENLAAGTYFVAEEMPPAWQQVKPGFGPSIVPVGTTGSESSSSSRRVRALTYTGSTARAYVDSAAASGAMSTSATPANSLIHLDTLRTSPVFPGITGKGYSVAVLDTGIDLNHPAFGPDADHNGIADRIVYQYDFADNDNNASDFEGHGSNVASIIGSQDSTYQGMAPDVNIIALKVFSNSGIGEFSYAERALQWVVANAAAYKIVAVNMSLSDSVNWSSAVQMYGLGDELAALASMNVIVVSAAGNAYKPGSTQGVAYPAADPNSLAVGAVWPTSGGPLSWSGGAIDFSGGPDRIVSFSQRSTTLSDIFAPGVSITGADAFDGFNPISGTSQASPHVAGIVALAQQLAARELGRRLSFNEIAALLKSTGQSIFDGDDEDDNVPNTNAEYWRLDAQAMMTAIDAMGMAYHLGFVVALGDSQAATARNFGNRLPNLKPAIPDLDSISDTGTFFLDNLTRLDNSSAAQKLTFLIGNTYAGTEITLLADGTTTIGTAIGEAGSTLVTTNGLVDLLDGSHIITARQRVPEGSGVSSGLSITIDTVAPAAPGALDLSASYDSGLSNTDNVTSFSTFQLSAVTLGVDMVTLYRDDVFFYKTLALFDYNVYEQPDGIDQWAMSVTDTAGNESAIGPAITVTVDTKAYGANADLDTAFGTAGVTVLPSPFDEPEPEIFSSVVRQPDGKLIGAGQLYQSETVGSGFGRVYAKYMSIVRFSADGTRDTSFGDGGEVYLTPGTGGEVAALALLPDGKILAAGMSNDNPSDPYAIRGRMCLLRLNPDGSLDTTFGSGGYSIPTLGTGAAFASSIAVTPAGKIVVGGASNNNSLGFAAVVQFSAQGTLEWTSYETLESYSQVRVDSSGGIIAAGNRLRRYTAVGTLDFAFGSGGVASIPGINGLFKDAEIQSDGKIVVAGVDQNSGKALLARFLANGQLDTSFGAGGYVLGSSSGSWSAIEIGASGTIHAAGTLGSSAAIGRFTTTGAGHLTLTAPVKILPGKSASDIALLPDEREVVVGEANMPLTRVDRYIAQFAAPTVASFQLRPSDDTGLSGTDRITRISTPTFELTLPPDHFARVYRNGTLVSTNYFAGTSFTAAVQADGSAMWTIAVVDRAGNVASQFGATVVTVDATPPVVTASRFVFATSQRLEFDLTEDLRTTLTAASLVLQRNGLPESVSAAVSWSGNTASFNFTSLLPDGNYHATLDATDVAGNPVTFVGIDFFVLGGDANRDAVVNDADLSILSTNWNTTGKTLSQGDFNYDGRVDVADFKILAANWQKTPSGAVASSEPMPALIPIETPPPPPSSSARRTARVISLIQ
jgi:uncharacterized delta-60 repeat protein